MHIGWRWRYSVGARPLPLKVAPIQRSVTTDFHLQSRRDSDCQLSELKTGSAYVLCLTPEWITEKEKGQHTDVGQNSWGYMKCAQHAARNPKYEKSGLLRQPWWWHLKILKGPPTHMVEGGHNFRNRTSTPTHSNQGKKCGFVTPTPALGESMWLD